MRLSPIEITAIKRAVYEVDQEARIFLFGSRVDDKKRGGDIDLLILSRKIDFELKGKIRRAICSRLGEQKIDILISKDIGKEEDPFTVSAFEQGIEL